MIWLVMIGSGIFTFISRFLFIGVLHQREIPPSIKKFLGYVSTAVLAAIIAPEILLIQDQVTFMDNPKIPAVLLAAWAALLTSNVLVTIATGLTVFWVINNVIWF